MIDTEASCIVAGPRVGSELPRRITLVHILLLVGAAHLYTAFLLIGSSVPKCKSEIVYLYSRFGSKQ